MKKQLVFAFTLVLLFSIHLNAQTTDSCTGNTSKVIIDGDDALYFNLQGLNLNAYNWDDPNINCHINLMLDAHRSSMVSSTWGWILIGTGASGLGAAIALTYWIDGVAPIYVVSVGSIGGGIACLIKASKQKKVMNYHLNVVSGYYREQGLN
ncbi:MAG TPA: hypothetical protein PLJ43_05505 [Chitinophagales bacterium]|nr:hypothetical protein [Chitinophagales bacterium]